MEKMATEKENNIGDRFIEDSGLTLQNPENLTPSSSSQGEQAVNHPTVLAVPLFSPTLSSSVPSHHSIPVTYKQAGSEDASRVAAMSSGPEKSTQAIHTKVDSGHAENLSYSKGVSDLAKVDPSVSKSLSELCQKSSASVKNNSVQSSHQSLLWTSGKTEVPVFCQSKSDSEDKNSLQRCSTGLSTSNEPLNLSLGQKSSEKVIASSLFGVITKQSTPGKESEVVIPGRSTYVTSSSSDYKIAHPIGSRKVTENVITYHEPMFQSVANTLFENQKNLLMGKRKLEEDRNKGDSSLQDLKKIKLETPNSPNKILDGKVIGKKKCTIENIIERIRTEKTLSRGGNAQTSKMNEFEKEKSKSVQSLQSEHNSFEKCREMSGNTGLDQVKNGNANEQKQEGSVPKEVKGSNDIKKEIVETGKIVEEKIMNKNYVTKDKSVPKKCESDSNKSVKSECNTFKLTSETNLSKPKKSDLSSAKQKTEGQQQKQMKTGNSSLKKMKADSGSPKKIENGSLKQKKGQVRNVKLSSSSGENATAFEEKKGSSVDKKYSPKSCKSGDKSKLDIKMKKFTKMKGLNKEKAKNKKGDVQNDSSTESDEEGELTIKQTIGEKVKVKRNIQNTINKSVEGQKKMGRKKSEKEICSKKSEEKGSVTTKNGDKKQSAIKKKPEKKPKATRQKKQKLPIACRRVKREASLNAAMFLNILNEKSPRMSKLSAQRSKSDSDIKEIQILSLQSSHSLNDVDYVESETNSFKKGIKGFKKERVSPFKNNCEGAPKLEKQVSQEDFVIPKTEPKSPKKTTSPKRKVSFSDSMLEDIFDVVIQKSIEATGKHKMPEKKRRGSKGMKETKFSEIRKKKENIEQKKTKKNVVKLKKEKKEKKFRLQKIKQAIKLTVTKSPEEVAERKRKANLARLERAKELMKTERKVSEKNSAEEKDSDDSLSVASEKEDSKSVSQSETDSKPEENKKVKAKKGALCRAARTHVSVESKTVVENTVSSPRWCECCQSSYYPYQPTQGTQVWRIKHLVDKDSSKSPEPIQSSSNHFIAAHARCEVRPYASPSHVSVIDSTPYVGQIVPHGHIQCSACSCGHSGVFHPGQCQNCTIGGVSNMLPCQRYGSTYSVTYPHTHGSYTHCGCGACYPAGSYHHSVGQTLIHQPQMSMSAESSILLHHPVQLQVTHETTHPVTMPTISHSHTDSSLTHSVQPVPLQLSHSEQNLNNLTHMCQLSQGEVTNVSVMASSSPCDHEIDVGTRDDMVKSVPNIFQLSNAPKNTDKVSKHEKTKKTILKEPKVKIKRTELKEPTVKLHRSKSCDSHIKGSVKVKDSKKMKDSIDAKVKLKEKKKSSLLLIKQKQKQLEQKTLKLSQKKESKSSGELTENFTNSKKARVKSGDNNKVPKKVKNSGSVDQKKDEKGEKEQQKRAWHGWSWEGEGVVKKVMNIFDGQTVERKCYNAIRHDDGDMIQVKDCVLVRSGLKEKDIPFVAKVSNFWEDLSNGEMMMSVLWFYRPEHAEGGPIYGSLENEVFAAKHKDETLVACIEDRGYVLTFNEYCRFMAEVERTKSDLPPRKKVVPEPEEAYPSNRIPPVDINPENVFLCRQVYDIKLKRVLKNPS